MNDDKWMIPEFWSKNRFFCVIQNFKNGSLDLSKVLLEMFRLCINLVGEKNRGVKKIFSAKFSWTIFFSRKNHFPAKKLFFREKTIFLRGKCFFVKYFLGYPFCLRLLALPCRMGVGPWTKWSWGYDVPRKVTANSSLKVEKIMFWLCIRKDRFK